MITLPFVMYDLNHPAKNFRLLGNKFYALKIYYLRWHTIIHIPQEIYNIIPDLYKILSRSNLRPEYVNASKFVTSFKIITFEKPLKSIRLSISPPADIATHKLKFRQGKIRDPRKSESPEFSRPPSLSLQASNHRAEGGRQERNLSRMNFPFLFFHPDTIPLAWTMGSGSE